MTAPMLRADRMRAASWPSTATGPLTLDGAAWGTWLEGGLLSAGHWPDRAPRVLTFTGSMSGSLDEGDLRNWMPAGIEACRAGITQARARASEAGQKLLIVPHALHLVSDLHSALRCMREHQGIGLALAPCSLLTGSMLGHAADHLARILGTLGPMADAIILHGLERTIDADGEPSVRTCPWGAGAIDARLVESLLPDGVPVLALTA
ncbi:MAG: hypothetical protein RL005_1427 [Planctomycetota bacterium]|jgi:hypothetical protein